MNIDKDIENLKEIIDLVKEEIKNNDENTTAILDITDLKSLDTVLSELETYKKIAEKLAITILEIDVEEKDVYETICKSTPNNRCEEFENGNCNQCILDWARKEVDSDGNK